MISPHDLFIDGQWRPAADGRRFPVHDPADGSELAQATAKVLGEKSPRGMVVTLKLLRLARKASSLEECLVREYRAALEVFASDDFREGVRAAVIDKDRNPKWSPPDIEDVTPEMVAAYFAEIGTDELKFP